MTSTAECAIIHTERNKEDRKMEEKVLEMVRDGKTPRGDAFELWFDMAVRELEEKEEK